MEPESVSIENCCGTIELSEQGDILEECTLHKITTTEDIMPIKSTMVKHKMVSTEKNCMDDIDSVVEVMPDEKISNSNEDQDGGKKRSTLKRILRRRSNTCAQLNDWMSNVLTKKRN